MRTMRKMSKVLPGAGLVFLLAVTLVGHAVAQTCIEPPSGLVSWWPGDGNTNDIQGGNNGTLQNGATFAAGKVGQAFSFNGNSQYVTTPAQVYSLQAGTVDFWVNWDGNLGSDLSDVFIGTWLGDNNRSPTFFVRASGEIMFELGDVVLQTTGVTLVPNMWYHLAMTYTQTSGSHNFNVYVNGILTNSDTATGITDFADTITVGAYLVIPDRIEQFTQGRIDELEIFNRALSTAEIQAIYNAGSAGKCKGLTFTFSGFFPPISNLPVLNIVKAGQAIPVKFNLNGNQGLNIFATGYPVSQQISCSTEVPLNDVQQTVTAGGSSLTYDPSTDQYTYVWKTDKSWVGTCHQLIVRLIDESNHVANFQFK